MLITDLGWLGLRRVELPRFIENWKGREGDDDEREGGGKREKKVCVDLGD